MSQALGMVVILQWATLPVKVAWLSGKPIISHPDDFPDGDVRK